jgi:hypothetical protein
MTAIESKKKELPPPMMLAVGTIVTLKMRGHTRSPNQQDYYAPAIVLAQYFPHGEIDALVWDSSAGAHFASGYAIRELGVRGDGNEREMFEIGSNIGEILFSPEEFKQMSSSFEELVQHMGRGFRKCDDKFENLEKRLATLEKDLGVKK